MKLFNANAHSIPTNLSARRYDLDHLRVVGLGLIFIYHLCVFYGPTNWVIKSTHSGHFVDGLLLSLTNPSPWALILLFFISGVSLRFATDKAPPLKLAKKQFLRLGVPLIFGILVICPPQAYYQFLQDGMALPNFLKFSATYLLPGHAYPDEPVKWEHLWYLAYLLAYTLCLLPFIPIIKRFMESHGDDMLRHAFDHPFSTLWLIPLPFILYRFTLDPHFQTTLRIFHDWAHHFHRFSIFFLGFLLAKNPAFWSAIARYYTKMIWAAAAMSIILAICVFGHIGANITLNSVPVLQALNILYEFAIIGGLLGLAQHYLNRPSPALSYFLDAGLPVYILHQTIIVIAGYYLTRLPIHTFFEVTLLLIATFGGSFGIYHFCIRPFNLLRFLFGLPAKQTSSETRKMISQPTKHHK
ncbi:acyltransferase family protein [Hirschia litorea]|uniref:Acyltransferase family protein n=1 Tax=Hirschia litorea TaxID=1199156 RepID=A0ABW2IKV0_9PROT